jgi:hypothetical protein
MCAGLIVGATYLRSTTAVTYARSTKSTNLLVQMQVLNCTILMQHI